MECAAFSTKQIFILFYDSPFHNYRPSLEAVFLRSGVVNANEDATAVPRGDNERTY